MRGKAEPVAPKFTIPGITPAYAGKRMAGQRGTVWHQDHPRLCGEKRSKFLRLPPILGSPPPMRGKAAACVFLDRGVRDHPRLCGEKFLTDKFSRSYVGSPPPMRGKVFWSTLTFGVALGSPPPMRGKD